MSTETIVVSEIFKSIQGEGLRTGTPSVFVRLTGCNLMCGKGNATWTCDSIEVWKKGNRVAVQQLAQQVNDYKLNNIVVTGGEPLLQQTALSKFFSLLNQRIGIEIETNGTIKPLPDIDAHLPFYNVSIKLQNSGEEKKVRLISEAIKFLAECERSMFKFVVAEESDMREIQKIIDCFAIRQNKIMLMPAGSTRDELNRVSPLIAKLAIEQNYVYSDRTHIRIWDKATGV
ncbi:7-carboxy-7-deazaguanine synthase QueE [Candidatus Parcubacteria bacterium]|nr:MAG: 7-carboxy-7-deazaguanine synthase QueE [Candidatus Parcubacteria bacterium]